MLRGSLLHRPPNGARRLTFTHAAASRYALRPWNDGAFRTFRQLRTSSLAVTCQRLSHRFSCRRAACRAGPAESGRLGNTRQRSAKRERQMVLAEEYRDRLGTALKSELDEEVRAMKERLQEWPQRRLEAEGYALFGLPAKMDGRLYKDRVVRFLGTGVQGLLPSHHQFCEGDMVAISQNGPLDESADVVEGVVLERANRYLRVSIRSADAVHLDVGLRWRLDLSSNTVAYERSLAAVVDFSDIKPASSARAAGGEKKGRKKSKAPKETEGSRIGEACMAAYLMRVRAPYHQSVEEEVEEGTSLSVRMKEALRFASKSPPWAQGAQGGAQRGALRSLLKETEGSPFPLNSTQMAAIEAACERRFTLWIGPPGTGKTRTLLRYLGFMRRLHPQLRILATADSNTAVDNLVGGLIALGLNCVRLGHPSKVAEHLRDSTLEARLSRHPLTFRAVELRSSSVMQRESGRRMNNPKQRQGAATSSARDWDAATRAEAAAVADILDQADVVAATCVGAGDPVLEGRRFEILVVDEATQATEASVLIPLVRSGAHTAVLVGDPAQLPPTVISQRALHLELDVSLFQRLESCGLAPLLLTTQYRMHPAIAAFPSAYFYGGRLLSFPRPADRPPPHGIAWPRHAAPLLFLDCLEGREEGSGDGASKRNRVEAAAILRLLAALLANGLSGTDIGIVTPYSAQVRLLKELVGEADLEEAEQVEISSVDGFQGREKEVILFSTVRSNPEQRLGFVADRRRMNVALTRAKRGLIVVGAERTLREDDAWRAWLHDMKASPSMCLDENRLSQITLSLPAPH